FCLLVCPETSTKVIGCGQSAPGHFIKGTQELFVKDGDTVGFFQNGFELRVWVMCWGQLLTKVQKWPDHIGLHWSGTKQRNINDEIINGFGFEFTNKFPLTWGLNLKTTQRVSRFDHCISLGIIVWNMFKIDGFAGGSGNLIDSIGDCGLHTYA